MRDDDDVPTLPLELVEHRGGELIGVPDDQRGVGSARAAHRDELGQVSAATIDRDRALQPFYCGDVVHTESAHGDHGASAHLGLVLRVWVRIRFCIRVRI